MLALIFAASLSAPPPAVVTVDTTCAAGRGACVDDITAFHLCGETVYVGPLTPNYYVLPGAECRTLPGPMSSVGGGSDGE